MIGGFTKVLKTNKLYNIDCREGLKQLKSNSINCVIASPPYYGLRDYRIKPSIWGGDLNCEHDFLIKEKKCDGGHSGGVETSGLFTKEQAIKRKEGTGSGNIIKEGFCLKCDAWKGSLGLEPNFELYIKHLCDIYDQVKRVLKPTGTCWVNLGDTYGGHKGEMRNPGYKDKEKGIQYRKDAMGPKENFYLTPKKYEKCLLMLPQRFAIEMINRGWILRNVIIWHKPNCMPSSAKDRFTVDFEYVYFFVKSNKTQYWINEKTRKSISTKPLGIKGIENIDWEWRECEKCLGTGVKHKKCKACEGEGWIYNILLQPEKCSYCNGLGRIRQDKECKSCKGKGIKKYNFWTGRQYWFEQRIEKYKGKLNRWGGNKFSEQTLKTSKYIVNETKADNMMRITHRMRPNPSGRNKRTVWSIPTKANPEAHFATFPPDLVKTMILSGCPKFICTKCGKPRERIIETIRPKDYISNFVDKKHSNGCGGEKFVRNRPLNMIFKNSLESKQEFKGYSDCGCNVGFKPGIVLDPFTGLGTTLLTAWKLGRNHIGFEISKEYCKIANKNLRLTNYIRLDNFIYEKQIEV